MNTNIDNIGSGGVCGKHGSWASKDPAGQCPGCYSSSDLDKRLQEILHNLHGYDIGEVPFLDGQITEAIAAIHSALKDEGYADVSQSLHFILSQKGYLTRAEWFERFTKEVKASTYQFADKTLPEQYVQGVEAVLLAAARRASGIEEDKNGD